MYTQQPAVAEHVAGGCDSGGLWLYSVVLVGCYGWQGEGVCCFRSLPRCSETNQSVYRAYKNCTGAVLQRQTIVEAENVIASRAMSRAGFAGSWDWTHAFLPHGVCFDVVPAGRERRPTTTIVIVKIDWILRPHARSSEIVDDLRRRETRTCHACVSHGPINSQIKRCVRFDVQVSVQR